jgi:hypothetical protein
MQLLQSGASTTPCTADPVGAARTTLDQLGVKVIVMGPMAYGEQPALQKPVENYLDHVAGGPARRDEGALVWNYDGGPA